MIAPLVASSVVGAASHALSAMTAPTQSAPSTAQTGPSFSQVMDVLTNETIDSLKHGEASAISSVHGKLSVQQTVDAVMSAERSLHTAIAIRDKAVSAYQEISRMAI